jgi:hypothetical protein
MRLLALSAVILLAPGTVPSDDASLHLSSGDDYTVLGALAELPVSTDTDALMIQTGDLVAATELSGLERPSEPDFDAVSSWIGPLTGIPREEESFAPLFVPLGEVFNHQYLRDVAEFDAALGWSLVDADAFVEQSSPPDSFAVLTGDFDDATLNADLAEVADGVVSYGEGDDFETNLSAGPSPVDPLGRPVRLAQDGDRIAVSFSTPFTQEWLAGPDETLADDSALAPVATALDDADVVAAVLVRVEPGLDLLGGQPISSELLAELQDLVEDQVPPAPFDAVGFGWNAVDGESAITVAYHFSSAGEAADSVASLENLYREGTSFTTMQPMSEYVTIDDIAATADVVAVSLSIPDGSRPQVIYDMLLRRDLPFISR